MLLSLGKGQLVVAENVFGIESFKLQDVRTEMVDDGTKPQPGSPGRGHIQDLDPLVAFRDNLAPFLKSLGALECHLSQLWGVLANCNTRKNI